MAYLEKHEIDAMLSVPDRARAQGRRDYALLLFLYNTGARASEAARATVADLAPDTRPCASGRNRQRRSCARLCWNSPTRRMTWRPSPSIWGHVDREGEVLAPFRWDEERRLELRAKLDALYFHLYGITDRDDIRYVYSTFPIVERHEMQAYGSYRSRELCLAWFNALGAGNPQAEIAV